MGQQVQRLRPGHLAPDTMGTEHLPHSGPVGSWFTAVSEAEVSASGETKPRHINNVC